mgnify:CR=1 FL=1
MPNKKLYNYDAPKAHHPGKFPDLSGDGRITKKDILIGRGVIKSGGGPKMVGSKEKYTEGNFAEMHHMKMMGSPLYYGPEKNTEVVSEKKDVKQIKKEGRELQNSLNKELSKPMTQQNKSYINQLQGAIGEKKKEVKSSNK